MHGHEEHVKVRKVERLSPTRVRLSVEVPSESVASHEESAARQYGRSAKLPGFRPGKAPLALVRQHYGDQIRKDVLSHLLEAGLAHAIQEAKLYPVNRPSVRIESSGFNGEGAKDLVFDAEYEVRPDISLGDYKKIPVKVPSTTVTEEEIGASLEKIRERLATLEPVEGGKPEKGLFAVVKVGFTLQDGDQRKDEPKEFTVEIGQGRLLPEIEAALPGFSLGERRQVPAIFPAEYADKTLAGRPVVFDLELLELKKKALPPLDDSLADTIDPGKKLSDLKEQIRLDLEQEKREEQRASQRSQLLEHLLRTHSFEVPASLVAQRAQFLHSRLEQELARRGQRLAPLSDKDREDLKRRAEEQVRGSMILAEIAAKEAIGLDTAQVEARVTQIATQLGKPLDEAKKWLDERGLIDSIQEEVLTDQVFDFLLKSASLVEESPSARPK